MQIPIYRLALKRIGTLRVAEKYLRARSLTRLYAALISAYICDSDREHLVVLTLDRNDRYPTAIHQVAVGSPGDVEFRYREVLKPAMLMESDAIVMGHNHPNWDVQPSDEDIASARNISQFLKRSGIQLIDALIVGDNGYYSLKTHGKLKEPVSRRTLRRKKHEHKN